MKLINVEERISKTTGKPYNVVVIEEPYTFNMIIEDKQVEACKQVVGDDTFQPELFMKSEFNKYTRKFETKFIFGL